MKNFFKHLGTVNKHRYLVWKNGVKLGIGWHCLFHDFSKYSKDEFRDSAKYYQGNTSPIYEERIAHNYFSFVTNHHVGRNKHHWEYWCQFYVKHIVIKTFPYIYALEYVADVISASKTYNKNFSNEMPYEYVMSKIDRYFMTKASKEFILWCFEEFRDHGFEHLDKKTTKAKYDEITKKYPDVEIYKLELKEPDFKKGDHD